MKGIKGHTRGLITENNKRKSKLIHSRKLATEGRKTVGRELD